MGFKYMCWGIRYKGYHEPQDSYQIVVSSCGVPLRGWGCIRVARRLAVGDVLCALGVSGFTVPGFWV